VKYIIIEAKMDVGAEDSKLLIPIVFCQHLNHNDTFESIKHQLSMKHGWTAEIYSAGSINMDGVCYGKSITLGIGSKEGDTARIRRHDYTHGLL
jgi:hypothetical protein